MDLLIQGGTVLTMNPKREIFDNGFLVIHNGRIAEVGRGTIPPDPNREVIHAEDQIILPGWINGHNHLIQALYRGLGDTLPLPMWIGKIFDALASLTREKAYVGASLALIELIHSGVTTTADSHFSHVYKDSIEGVLEAIQSIGIRGVIARGSMDRSVPEIYQEKSEESLKELVALSQKWNSERIRMSPEALGVLRCSEKMIKELSSFSREMKTPFFMHIASSKAEAETIQQRKGCGVFEYLDRLGVLNERCVAAHCIWLAPKEPALLKDKGVKVVYNPVSNMFLGSGVAPIPILVKEGVRVALGLDGAASNNSQNFFETMKFASLLQRITHLDTSVLPPEEILEMATIRGAEVLGIGKEAGSLEKGKWADLIFLDSKSPRLNPKKKIVSNIVYSACPSDITKVMVGGRVIYDGKSIVTVDETEIIERVNFLENETNKILGGF